MQLLKDNLVRAQSRMKRYADLKRSERTFAVGDWVYLRLQPYRQSYVSQSRNLKLSPRFYGPFQIEARIGEVAYKLHLPSDARVHPLFHVSQLKCKLGTHCVPLPSLPPVDSHSIFKPQSHAILERKVRSRGHLPVTEVLIHWSGQEIEDATWELLQSLRLQFPHLVDKVL